MLEGVGALLVGLAAVVALALSYRKYRDEREARRRAQTLYVAARLSDRDQQSAIIPDSFAVRAANSGTETIYLAGFSLEYRPRVLLRAIHKVRWERFRYDGFQPESVEKWPVKLNPGEQVEVVLPVINGLLTGKTILTELSASDTLDRCFKLKSAHLHALRRDLRTLRKNVHPTRLEAAETTLPHQGW